MDAAECRKFIDDEIKLNEGRTLEMKKAFYEALAERLHQELGLRLEDIFINLVEVKKENWSFGNGIANMPNNLWLAGSFARRVTRSVCSEESETSRALVL